MTRQIEEIRWAPPARALFAFSNGSDAGARRVAVLVFDAVAVHRLDAAKIEHFAL
jgi:hypothetical protein